eukprot:g34506.t1
MVEELNRYFVSVFMVKDTSNIPELKGSQGTEMSVMTITKEKVLGKWKGLKVDESPRPDGLFHRVLKEMAEEIVEALAVIFQESLKSGRVPKDWKMANVTLLFKKGVRQKTGNYTPVRLTSAVGKILESIFKDEIAEYLEVR